MDLFLFGTLLDDALRHIVLGRAVEGRPAEMPARDVRRAAAGDHPVLVPGAMADGLLLEGLSVEDAARLDFYEGAFGYHRESVTVEVGARAVPAQVYVPQEAEQASTEVWRLEDWQRDWAPLTRRAAAEAMALFGRVDAPGLRWRMPMIRTRADSSLRAETAPAPLGPREPFDRGAVREIDARRPYAQYFALDEIDLAHRHFDGGESETLTRAGLVLGDAVTVLPYDPVRDRVLLVEQFRFGPYIRGDRHPWSLEPVAGRIDPGETPEAAGRRETLEEAGVEIAELWPVASFYPCPGSVSEYVYAYVGLCDLPDGAGGAGGKDDEGEDIRSHLMGFEALMDLVAEGAADNGPLILTALWLQRRRAQGLPPA